MDHMVLQRGKPIPVWGTADPGAAITVKFGVQQASGKVDDAGHWKVELPAMDANATAQSLIISADAQSVTLNDILVGDVWICSGQSNMGVNVGASSTAVAELPQANHPEIRLFKIKRQASLIPKTDCEGTWSICTPETAKTFSAVGYYFGRDIAAAEKVPIYQMVPLIANG